MFALIQSALAGLAAIPSIINAIKDLQAAFRVQEMESKINQLHEAIDALAKAETKEQKHEAIKLLARSTNG